MKTERYFKLALVTGASGGIGKALCHLLASKGINLLITARDTKKLHAITEELHHHDIEITIITADLSTAIGRSLLTEKIHNSKPDLIINNAGMGLYGPALTYDVEELLKILNINSTAVLELTIEAARTLLSHDKRGIIINISSAAAFDAYPHFAVYAASKAFVNTFSEAFNEEISKHGIKILTSCPGQTNTKFSQHASGKPQSDDSNWKVIDVEYVARAIWRQILQEKPLQILDWRYRIANFLRKYCIPKKLSRKILQREIDKKYDNKEYITLNH